MVQDGGAYCSYGVVTILYSGALLGALYDIPNIRYDGYRVLTNKPACGAMRGHGTVNVRFAFESQLDEIAAQLVSTRRRSAHQSAQAALHHGQRSAGAELRAAGVHRQRCGALRLERSARASCRRARGLGMACSHYVSGAANSIIRSDMPHSTVNIKIDRDGGVVVYTGASDIGQGSDTMVAQIVAEVLGMLAGAHHE